MPLSYTMVSVLLRAHLQAFVMVALRREAIISKIFNIREASEFWLASSKCKTPKVSMPTLHHGVGSKGVRPYNFVKDHAIY